MNPHDDARRGRKEWTPEDQRKLRRYRDAAELLNDPIKLLDLVERVARLEAEVEQMQRELRGRDD